MYSDHYQPGAAENEFSQQTVPDTPHALLPVVMSWNASGFEAAIWYKNGFMKP
jgi:hypothetical protein